MLDLLPPLLQGLQVTLKVTAGAALLAIPLALLAGLGRLAPWRALSWPAACYVELFRGTSALVQLFWAYYVLPLFGLSLSAMTAGIVVLGLNAGAYAAEVVRGAVQGVPRGQREAAKALNFTPAHTLRRIVLPQAVAAMLPPAGNLAIELLKNTALVSLITIADLTFRAQLLRADTLRTVEIFGLVLALYFLVALCITGGMRLMERRLARRRGERA
ncbi:ectoine/hydroxyectoine ABC transporter permease subunit EhuC [Verticiella sediminum]|uniref:Ectoine/hydroxyectoine ABC transporter permease subunit EhuC n=1 Tax=Verticiella sediminum TaxID=1247510 RepID=A0A556A6E1_9BURK|nr:ectoine/hydroxyectoine ABC transporter permease subunit EhuC [Verticiella sediminum]TSH88461.1 ectoine/hydroxyectoine ABC transporter permease subunit EhuC [Verticiella sediminum]